MQKLEKFLLQFADKVISIAVHDLQTRKEIFINADEIMYPASTIKVAVMMEVFHQARQGSLSLDDRLPVINSFTSIADGSNFLVTHADDADTSLHDKIGANESIRELVRIMIVRSSNLATNLLIDKVGAKQTTTFLQSLGIHDVIVLRGVEDNAAFHRGLNSTASARGLAFMMKLIAEGKVITPQASQEMIQIMLGQEFNESIPALLPSSVQVAHKTGWLGNYYHDAGIVLPPSRNPYAIAIMTKGFPEDRENEAHNCMAQISKMIYEELIA